MRHGTEPVGGQLDDPRSPEGSALGGSEFQPLILAPQDPLPSPPCFVSRYHTVDDFLTLRYQGGVFLNFVSGLSGYSPPLGTQLALHPGGSSAGEGMQV